MKFKCPQCSYEAEYDPVTVSKNDKDEGAFGRFYEATASFYRQAPMDVVNEGDAWIMACFGCPKCQAVFIAKRT